MLETLLQAAREFGAWFVPWHVLQEYERGVVMRWGRVHREVGPGWCWLWPCGIEHVLSDNVVTTTSVLPTMSLTTRDGRSMVCTPVLTWKIRNVRKLLLEVEGRDTVLVDSACSIIASAVNASEWHAVADATFAEQLLQDVRKRAFRYGVEVESVGFQSLVACESLRLWTEPRREAAIEC